MVKEVEFENLNQRKIKLQKLAGKNIGMYKRVTNIFTLQDLRYMNTEKVEKYLFLLTILESNLMEYDRIKKDLEKV